MFTLYNIAFEPARNRKPDKVSVHHKNGDFYAISVTERSCSAPISKEESDYQLAFPVGTNSCPV